MHSFGAKEWADKCEQLEATIADLQGQVTELEGKNGFTQGTFSELYALRQRVAQLEKEKASTVAAAIELVDSKSCDTHKQEIKAEGFDVFYDKEKKAGCQRCLQADHTRVLRLVQAFRKINGTVTKLDVETQVILDAQPFIDLLTYRASLPAQPAQGGA